MITETIDLYEYFALKKPDGARGILSVICHGHRSDLPEDRKRSAMLILPGGGYMYVSPREAEPVAYEYLRHGINCFILDYSVAPGFKFPTQLIEAAMAMIFIRENADKYMVDKNHLSAIGFSAGGHLAGCLGTLFACEELDFLRNRELIRPDAVLLCYPVTYYRDENSKTHLGSFQAVSGNDEQLMRRLSIDTCIKNDSSPAFIWHTVEDTCVPVYGTLVTAKAYYEAGVPFELHVFEKGVHGLSVCTLETEGINAEDRVWIECSVNWLKLQGFTLYS